MLVGEEQPLYITENDEGALMILLSDQFAEYYQWIKSGLWGVNVTDIGSNHLDVLDFADRLLSLATIDFGPISVSIALLAFALYEAADRLIVQSYNIVTYPAVVGKAKLGKSKIGQTEYEIEPTSVE